MLATRKQRRAQELGHPRGLEGSRECREVARMNQRRALLTLLVEGLCNSEQMSATKRDAHLEDLANSARKMPRR